MRVMLTGALVAAAGSVLLEVAMRCWRRHDAQWWHTLWLALGVTALVGPILATILPSVIVRGAAAHVVVPDLTAALAVNKAAWTIAACVYGIGVTWSVVRLVIGVALIRKLAREAIVPDGLALTRLSAVNPEAGRLCRVHRRARVAMTIGWRDPIIVLPTGWTQWPVERLEAILEHELVHVHRADYVANLLAVAHQCFYWWSPFSWLIGARIRFLAELACDGRAAATIGRGRYARQLVASAEEALDGGLVGMLAPGATTSLLRRVRVLLGAAEPSRPLGLVWRVAAAAALAMVMVLIMSLRAAPAIASVFPHIGAGGHADRHADLHRH